MRDWPASVVTAHRRAVFLDRDGTINEDAHYPHSPDELVFLPRALDALRLLSEMTVQIIVVTNQAGIALGYFTQEQMSNFNSALRNAVEQAGGRIDAFYFCPSLEPKDLGPGQKAALCSKPSPGMLLEASEEFDIRLVESFMIGDKTSDISAGERAGCKTILVKTGKAGNEIGALPVEPDHVALDLYHAAEMVRSFLRAE